MRIKYLVDIARLTKILNSDPRAKLRELRRENRTYTETSINLLLDTYFPGHQWADREPAALIDGKRIN